MPDDHIPIPRLEEYYTSGSVVGWGEIPPEFQRKEQAKWVTVPRMKD